MSTCFLFHLSVVFSFQLSIHASMCSCLDLSISIVTSPYLSVSAYVNLSVPTSFHLSTCVCVCRSFSFYFFACFCPFVVSFPFSLLIHRSVDLAICLIVYLSADISKPILAILNHLMNNI